MLHGDRKDRINTDEPQPASGEVVAPEWIGDDARAEWARLAPDLVRTGVLTAWDTDAFAVLVTAIVHHRQAAQLVNTTGVVVANPNGAGAIPNPALRVVTEQARIITTYGGRFGLTPSDRAQLKIGGKVETKADAQRLLS